MPTNPDPTPPGGGGGTGVPMGRSFHYMLGGRNADPQGQPAPGDPHASIRYLRELLHEMNQVVLELETELEGPADGGP